MKVLAWTFRYLVFPALLAMIALAAVGGFLAYRENQLQGFLNAVPGGDDAAMQSTATRVVTPIEAPPAIEVESYAPGSEYPFAEWETVDDPAGFVDWVTVNGELVGLDELVSVRPGDVIGIGGWAGHRLLGMRFPEVLFSICDTVIGGVPVSGIREDISESVHPNLLYSGWEAMLFAADLPDCVNASLSVWGRPPVGATLRPVIGARRIDRIDDPAKPGVMVIHTEPIVRPEHARLAGPERITVPSSGISLRQCAGQSCPVMANVPPGELDAVFVEESDGWMLIQSAKGSGWVQAHRVGKMP